MQLSLPLAICGQSAEEIFTRAWRRVAPRAEAPEVAVFWRRSANAHSSARLSRGLLTIRLPDLLDGAPPEILEALAMILLHKLHRRRVPEEHRLLYNRWLHRQEVMGRLQELRRAHGFKQIRPARGEFFDLDAMFDDLNARYFQGSLEKPVLGWSARPSRTHHGHYDSAHNAVIVSKSLDRQETPRLVVEYILFHELLHIVHPVEFRGGKRLVHTKAFKQDEKRFENLREARELLRRL
jgi:hypothetical protein